MSGEIIRQDIGSKSLQHALIRTTGQRRNAGIVLFPTVMGVSPLELGFARDLVALGYDAMVADFYGRRFTPDERPAAGEAMAGLRSDRAAMRDLLLAIVAKASESFGLDETRMAATGYCFGGQCVLDLARSGIGLAGVAGFHAVLDPPGFEPRPIKARVIVYHGWDDPIAQPDKVIALATELTEGGADWQLHAFGHTGHGFTNPNATGAMPGIKFEPKAADRSWRGLVDYLDELFE